LKLAAFLLRYLRRHLGWVAVAGVAAVAYALTTISLIGLIEPVFSEVLLADASEVSSFAPGVGVPGGDGAEAAGAEEGSGIIAFFRSINLRDYLLHRYQDLKLRFDIDSREVVFFLPLLFLAVFLLRGLMSFISSYSFNRVGLASTTDIRNDLYSSILSQSSRFHAAHPSGELISRIVNDVAVMQNAISNRAVDMFQQSLTLLGMVYFLLSANLKLALISLVAAPLLLWPIVRFGRGMRSTSHRSQERMADLANLVGEGVRGHRVVKAFGMERFEDERFQGATYRHLRVNLWAQMLSSMSSPIVESMAAIFAVALLIYAGFQIRSGALSAALLITFLLNLFWMYDPIRKLNKVNLVLQQSLAATHRVYDLICEPNEIVEKPDAVDLATVEQSVVFENISFGYSGQGVLHEIDLEIRAGEVVALVGPSGAGKTTLVNLLPRFFDPDEGRLLIDGLDIRDASLSGLRSLIGLVTQETVLFNDSVRANLAYGRADLPDERIREAAAAAYADEFIMRLPQEYETVIGEGGYSMSGGQRQRLAIARALLKNAPILILDEATSHLDSHSEALVQKALNNLMRDRTTLVIAHRLSTVVKCGRIIVLEHGRIVEQGSHEELLARDGLYKQLYDLQFRA
jgi:subfamily B ATP-binding cassette protein MsbA